MNSRWICVIHRIYTPDWSQSHKISNDVGMSTSKFGTHPFPRRPFVLEPWMKRLPRSRLQLRTNAVTAISGSPPVPVFLDRSGCQIWGLYSYTKQFALWSHWWFARGILKSSKILHSGWWIISISTLTGSWQKKSLLGALNSDLNPGMVKDWWVLSTLHWFLVSCMNWRRWWFHLWLAQRSWQAGTMQWRIAFEASGRLFYLILIDFASRF